MWQGSTRGRGSQRKGKLGSPVPPHPPPSCCMVSMSLGPCNTVTAEAGDPKWNSKGCEDWSEVMASGVSSRVHDEWSSNVQGRYSGQGGRRSWWSRGKRLQTLSWLRGEGRRSKGGLGETQPCFYVQVPTRVGALEKLWNKHSWAVYH